MNPFDTSHFVPRLQCGEWGNWAALYVISDIGIWLAYMAIPAFLLMTLISQKCVLGLKNRKAFVIKFSVFIFFCGFGHLFDAIMFVHPAYRLLSLWHFGTMLASWVAAITLPRLLLKYLILQRNEEAPGG